MAAPRPLAIVVAVVVGATTMPVALTAPPGLAQPGPRHQLTTTAASPVSQAEPAAYIWQAPNSPPAEGEKQIALTFDDGPSPYTPQVLAVLERYHVPATFFEIGEWVAVYPQYTRELAAAGYPVEDHTWSHPDLATITAAQVAYQVAMAQDEIRSVTGQTPACVRPPYNAWDTTVLDEIAGDGLTTMSYSVDSRDWAQPGTGTIVDNVLRGAFPGAVVDMHDGGGPRYETVEALPEIITRLRAEGYTFVAICGSSRPASSPSVAHALVLSARATASSVGAGGGTVAVAGRVEHARSCQLRLLSRQSFPVVYPHKPTSACSHGRYSARATIGPNTTPVQRVVAFALVARNSTSIFSARFYVLVAAAWPAKVLSARATPGVLGAGGGTVAVAGRVEHARSCQLRLLSRQSFPVVYPHKPTSPCSHGRYSARATIGPNTTPVQRVVAFALVARNSTSIFSARFYVLVAAHAQHHKARARESHDYSWCNSRGCSKRRGRDGGLDKIPTASAPRFKRGVLTSCLTLRRA